MASVKKKGPVKEMMREKKQNKNKQADEEGERARSSSDESDLEEEGGTHIGGVYIPPQPPAACSNESIGPRLIITHITNVNFKSYAGKTVLGPFHKSFTSIIGPNGSGKSNVIDSMLFVFGYRANKIRSKKLSVLIHKSEHYQDIRSCTVEVHFVQINDIDDENFEVVPDSEVVIGRTAFNDNNSSFYTVNGRKAQFKQVARVLLTHGIDLIHNRFLILQGEVEQIAMMKPKALTEHDTGMLEYLEDIIGTVRYKRPLKKLEKKLDVLNEERQEKINRTKIAEKEKEALQEPMEKAVDMLKAANNVAECANKAYQKDIFDNKKILSENEIEKKSLEENIEGLNADLKKCQEEQSEKDKEIAVKTKALDEIVSKKEKMTEEFNQTENRAMKLKEEIMQTNKKRKKAIETKKQEEHHLAELEKLPEMNKKKIEEMKNLEEKLQKTRSEEEASVSKVLAGIRDKTKDLQDQKDAIHENLFGLKQAEDEAKAKYNLANTELEVYLNNEKKCKEKLQQLKETYDKTVTSLREKKSLLEDLEMKLPAGERELANSQKELEEVKNRESHFSDELYRIKAQIQEKESSMQASRSRNRVLDFIMKQKAEGVLPGVFGRLGDLGGIDAKYDCAVSTACGPLDYIVTDTVRTAKQCVEQLKKYNLGRGNFIALDQQQGLINQYKRPINTPENVLRLFDLIKVNDERVKPAFYFGLRDTLVANDLNQARRCAYGSVKYRVVTLSGEIIEIAGTMSGGGRDKRTGRMGRSATVLTDSSPGELPKLKEKATQLQEKVSNLHSRYTELEEKISTLSKDVRKWKSEIGTTAVDVKSLSSQEPGLKKLINEQQIAVKEAASDPTRVKEMTKNVTFLKNEFDEAAEKAGVLERKIEELTKKINALTGEKLKEAQSKLDKVTEQLDKARAEITKLTVAITSSGRNSKKSKDKILSLTNEISAAEEKLLSFSELNKKLTETGRQLNEDIERDTNEIVELEETIKAARSNTSSFLAKINQIKASLIDENQKLTDKTKTVNEYKAIINIKDKKLKALKIQEIPDVEDQELLLATFTDEELEGFDLKGLTYLLTKAEDVYANLSKDCDPRVIKEYKEKSEALKQRLEQLSECTKRRDEVREGHELVKKTRMTEFIKGFKTISIKLKEMYQMITFGGDAELELKDTLDPFLEGVEFSVRPPKKSWKNISNLSGGEKTLSSLALVFALHYYKPSPLYVMDEIDAALDFKNVSIVGNYIKDRTKNAQFIIISLRSNMFELADVLVGIYKTYNCTKSTTITPKFYDSITKTNQARLTQEQTLETQIEIPDDDPDNTVEPLRKRAREEI